MDKGIDVVPLLVGMFAVADIFAFGFKKKEDRLIPQNYHMKGSGISLKELGQEAVNIIRSAIIGVVIGILPGIGGNTAGIFSYSLAKGSSKHPEEFGTGCVSGLAVHGFPDQMNINETGGKAQDQIRRLFDLYGDELAGLKILVKKGP